MPDQPSTDMRVGGPEAITLTVCKSCERNDRWQPLKARHFNRDGLCPGPVVEATYVRGKVAQ